HVLGQARGPAPAARRAPGPAAVRVRTRPGRRHLRARGRAAVRPVRGRRRPPRGARRRGLRRPRSPRPSAPLPLRAPRRLTRILARTGAAGQNRGAPPAGPRRAPRFLLREPHKMKILVAYKRVVDANVRIQVKPDGSGVVTDGVKLSANPFDEIALEEALRLRDKGIATEVVVATIAPADAAAHLRNGLAMGANRAIHVVADQPIQPLTAARALLKLVEKEQPDLVLLGKQAIDDDANQTGQ